jgi:hypothetical protein
MSWLVTASDCRRGDGATQMPRMSWSCLFSGTEIYLDDAVERFCDTDEPRPVKKLRSEPLDLAEARLIHACIARKFFLREAFLLTKGP